MWNRAEQREEAIAPVRTSAAGPSGQEAEDAAGSPGSWDSDVEDSG